MFRELDKDRHAYDGISRRDFIDSFEVEEDLVFALQDYLNISASSKITFVAYHSEVKQYLKATLADQLFGEGAYEEVFNQRDIMIDEVIKLSDGE